MVWELIWLPPVTVLLYLACSKEAREWLQAKASGLDSRPPSPVCVCGGEICRTGPAHIPEGTVWTYTCRSCGRYQRHLER